MPVKKKSRMVVVRTSHRCTYVGDLMEVDGDTCVLANARIVIYWGTTAGIDQLAATGPTSTTKAGAKVGGVRLFGLIQISDVSSEGASAWNAL